MLGSVAGFEDLLRLPEQNQSGLDVAFSILRSPARAAAADVSASAPDPPLNRQRTLVSRDRSS